MATLRPRRGQIAGAEALRPAGEPSVGTIVASVLVLVEADPVSPTARALPMQCQLFKRAA